MTPFGTGLAWETARWGAYVSTCHSTVLPASGVCVSWLCPRDFVPQSPRQHIVWKGVREDRGHSESCSCVRKSAQPRPPQPLTWARGPCLTSQTARTQGSQALPPHWPLTKLVGIVECQRRPGREGAGRGQTEALWWAGG